MQNYFWPGNVRELENVVRRAALLAQSERRTLIRESDLPTELLQQKTAVEYVPLEDQILDKLRAFNFSRAAISRTATALGNRDRGTITEYFRGICFEKLVEKEFDVGAAAATIAGKNEAALQRNVQAKIEEYLANVKIALLAYQQEGKNSAIFKGLPKKYHVHLEKIIKHLSGN